MKPDAPVARKGDYTIVPCDHRVARELIERHHYARSASNTGKAFCATRDGRPVAAALFLPPLPPAARKHALSDPMKVTSLHRLVVAPGEPQNVASMLIAGALRLLRREGRYDTVITYADTARGHTGAVYRAANAEYLGLSGRSTYWIDPKTGAQVSQKAGRTRTAAQMRALGYERRVSPGKHIFCWRL